MPVWRLSEFAPFYALLIVGGAVAAIIVARLIFML
jgi:hypothetical protein